VTQEEAVRVKGKTVRRDLLDGLQELLLITGGSPSISLNSQQPVK